jgi:hypothetical protein
MLSVLLTEDSQVCGRVPDRGFLVGMLKAIGAGEIAENNQLNGYCNGIAADIEYIKPSKL